MEREFLWNSPWPGTRRGRILHGVKGCDRALVASGIAHRVRNLGSFLMIGKPLHVDVNEQIESAHTLASRFYTDPAVLEIERARIFRRSWQPVGTLSQACGEVNGRKYTIAATD